MTFFSLLPNARTKLSAIAAPPAAGQSRRTLAFGVEVRANGAAVGSRINVGAELITAGDVVGVDPRMISRVEPAPGANAFEPNYMPFVDFADADFPWRYSFASGTGTRVRPWLVLIALQPDEFEFVESSGDPAPRIRVKEPGKSLPQLGQSWAFAHVHVAQGSQRVAALPHLIATEPEAHSSRLLCPRRLESNSPYSLFLVPATEAGRIAGLELPESANPPDENAWEDSTAADLELPVYFQSRFSTSALEDFELLARRLKTYKFTPESNAAKPKKADAAKPGFHPGYAKPGATFEIQDALIRADQVVEGYNTDPALATLLEKTLATVIAGEDAPVGDNENAQDPLVAMPPYGWRFRGQRTVTAANANAGRVVDRVNLDLKFRHAAGLGARVVRENQEAFARICWSQYREVVAANLALGRLRTSKLLTEAILRKHAARLADSTIAVLTENLHDLALLPGRATLGETFSKAGVPASFVSRGLRRVASKRSMRSAVGPKNMLIPAPVIPGVGAPAPGRVMQPPVALGQGPSGQITALFGTNVLVSSQRGARRSITVGRVDLAPVKASLQNFFGGLPTRKAKALLKGLANKELTKLDPVMRGPVVTTPLVEPLRVVESKAIMRGLEDVPLNTVSVLKENRAFIEAFLVGANHEMNHELRWREFPTDLRGTIFRRFWNRHRPPADPTGDDASPIDGWTNSLGSNYPPQDNDRSASLVLLIKGDIIRKFGMILVELNKATTTKYARDSGTNFAPIFSGQLAADAAYYGFDVSRATVLADLTKHFFVLYEAPGRVRFGLDAASAKVRRERFAIGDANLPFPLRLLDRDPKKSPIPQHLRTGKAPPVQPAKWDDLSWTHVKLDGAAYIDMSRTSPAVAEAPNYWPAANARDSAMIARSFWQKPIAAVIPAKRILT